MKTEQHNAIKAPDPSRLWFCSLHRIVGPIWEWWRLFAILRSLSESWRAKHSQHSDDGPPASDGPWETGGGGAGGGGVCNQRDHVREEWWRMGTRVSRLCIYIPSCLTSYKVIDRQTESFCHTKFSMAASCPVPPLSTKVKKKQKKTEIICSIEGDSWISMG